MRGACGVARWNAESNEDVHWRLGTGGTMEEVDCREVE